MRHVAMMTSSNENISSLLALCVWNSPVTGEFPLQRQVTRGVDIFFDVVMWYAIVPIMTSL